MNINSSNRDKPDSQLIQNHGTCGIGPCMDVVAHNGLLYAIQNNSMEKTQEPGGALHIFSLADPAQPAQISRLYGLGNARQIIIDGNTAIISAREDGLLLIDVHDPYRPVLLARYDTIEYATAVACCHPYVFTGCRSFGIEIIDITMPDKPCHVSSVRAGEVQSLYYDNGLLYTGSWSQRKSCIIDVSDVVKPALISEIPLGGRGDGIFVKDGLLYAVTGQHAQGKAETPADPAYGWGNGFEIHDVHDPLHPDRLSVTNFGFRYYYPNYDMWSIMVSYPYAYISHTFNGVYIYDISDPIKPVNIEQLLIPVSINDPECRNIITPDILKYHPPVLPFDPEKILYSPVCGITVTEGFLYIAAAFTDLHVVSSGAYFHEPELNSIKHCARLTGGSFYDSCPHGTTDGVSVYRFAETNIHAAIQTQDMIYIAGGMGGILAVSAQTMQECFHAATDGPALDIARYEETLLVAEGNAGLSIWKINNNTLNKITVFTTEKQSVRQVVVSENGRYALLHVGCMKLYIIDITDPWHPCLKLSESSSIGQIYDHHISTVGVDGRYYSCFWNASYCKWFDLGADEPRLMPWVQHHLGFSNGITASGSLSATDFLLINRGGYAMLDSSTATDFATVGVTQIPGTSISGKPYIWDNILFVSNRVRGQVYIIDISDFSNPRLLRELQFSGYPGLVSAFEGRIAIPLDNQGIAICRIDGYSGKQQNENVQK